MRILTLLFVALLMPLHAQQEKMSVRTLAITQGDYASVWTMDATTPVKLEFPSIQPSEPYRLTRTSRLSLFQGGLDAKGKPADPAPASLKLPDSGDILLLSWTDGGKLKFLPIEDMSAVGRYNDWFVINSTAESIGIQIGGNSNPVVFPAASCKPLHVDAPSGKGATVVMATNDSQTWNKFYSTYWPVQADKRCLVLIVQVGENIEVRQIFEALERKVAQTDANSTASRNP